MRWASERIAIHPFVVITAGFASICAVACATSSPAYGVPESGSDVEVRHDTGQRPRADAGDATATPSHDATSIFGGKDAGADSESDAVEPPDAPGRDAPRGDVVAHPDSSLPADAGHDARPEHDAHTPPAEAGRGDATRDTASSDGATEDSSTSDTGTHDSGAKDSSTRDTSTPHDSGGSCTAIPVPGGTAPGLSACGTPSTPPTCAPGSLSGFNPTTPAPKPPATACQAGQITQIYNDCLNGGTCLEQEPGEPGYGCYQCLFSNETDATWGPLVLDANEIATLNMGGCLELLEPCNSACAAAFENDYECEEYACASNCAASINASGSLTEFNACTTAIDDCTPGCATYSHETLCWNYLTGSEHPGSVCFPSASATFEQALLAIGPVFCGGS